MRSVRRQTFQNQSIVEFIGALVCGAALAIGSYVVVANAIGGAGAATEGSVFARQTGVFVSGTVLAIYLSATFIRGYGGPLLNLGYLLAHFALTPALAIRLSGASAPDPLVLMAPLFSPLFVVEALMMGVVPLAAYIAGHTLWFRVAYSSAERVAWADEHLPDLYYDTLLDPARYDRQTTEVEGTDS